MMLRVDEVAKMLRCSESSIYRKTSRGEIPSYKIGGQRRSPVRIKAEDLDKYLRLCERRSA